MDTISFEPCDTNVYLLFAAIAIIDEVLFLYSI